MSNSRPQRRHARQRGNVEPSSRGRRPSRLGASDVHAALAQLDSASWADLIDHCGPKRGRETRAFRDLLNGLLASGEISRSRHGVYRLDGAAGEVERVAGEVLAHAGSALTIANTTGRTITLPTSATPASTAVRPGDRIEAVVYAGRTTALHVVEPSATPVVGLLRHASRARGRRAWVVEPVDAHFKSRIAIVSAPAGRDGDLVEVQLLSVRPREAEGNVLRVIEAGDEAARAAEAMLAAHHIPRSWSAEVLAECPSENVAATPGDRLDLRDIPFVTIDGEDARDFDDAVFAEPTERGGWRLLVAIADVSHYVRPGSALDRAARERGNSVYLPDRVVPMLPEALSNGLCSLVANEDRLVLACDMRISAQGRVSRYRIARAVIRSRARLAYDAVAAFLDGANLVDSAGKTAAEEVAASLRCLLDVYRALRRMRDSRGALDFDAREATVVLKNGNPTGVEPRRRNDAHRMIEEAMIAANVAAARHLESQRKRNSGREAGKSKTVGQRPPPVYRVHEPPDGEKLETLRIALQRAGQRLPSGTITPSILSAVCERARAASPWPGWVWDALVLRSLAQARYELRRLGHFGLALPTYVHFTSPIRRYADLLVHRMIADDAAVSVDELDAAAAHISMTERRAEQVERAVDAWLKCAFVEERVGESLAGTVAAVTGFGMFVELDGLFVQGLVHISKIGADYYHYLPESMCLVAERSGARFAPGDRVEVVVEEVSVTVGRIDLRLASNRRGRGRRRARQRATA